MIFEIYTITTRKVFVKKNNNLFLKRLYKFSKDTCDIDKVILISYNISLQNIFKAVTVLKRL